MSKVPSQDELSGETVKLRLIGAKTYVSRPLGVGVINPVEAGDVVTVPTEYADILLQDVWREGKHGAYPVWSTDLDAAVHLKSVDPVPIEAQREIDRDREAMQAALEAANARADAAEKRAEDIMARIENLEQHHAQKANAKEPSKPSGKQKAAPRRRASKSGESSQATA